MDAGPECGKFSLGGHYVKDKFMGLGGICKKWQNFLQLKGVLENTAHLCNICFFQENSNRGASFIRKDEQFTSPIVMNLTNLLLLKDRIISKAVISLNPLKGEMTQMPNESVFICKWWNVPIFLPILGSWLFGCIYHYCVCAFIELGSYGIRNICPLFISTTACLQLNRQQWGPLNLKTQIIDLPFIQLDPTPAR